MKRPASSLKEIPADNRKLSWPELEEAIQKKHSKKDKKFVLAGSWKKFVRKQRGYSVYAVDGLWIRNNLCVYFGHGGHGLVHEFIPMNEIWISTRHYNEGASQLSRCICKRKTKNQMVSEPYFNSTTLHEIEECEQMQKGKKYWAAHQHALQKEREAAFLKDPYEDP